MKRFLNTHRSLAGGIVMVAWCGCLLAQPSNDDFANRQVLQGVSVITEASRVGATLEEGEPAHLVQHGEGSLWWEWTPSISGRYHVSTEGSDVDTVLAVYQGRSLDQLVLVSFNDDENLVGGVFTSKTTFFALEGTFYQIAVAAFKGTDEQPDEGPVKLSIESAVQCDLDPWSIASLGSDTVWDSGALPGNLLILDFWATWCTPCRAEIPIFNDLMAHYQDRGLTVIGVSVDAGSSQPILDFARDFPIEFPIARSSPAFEAIFGGISAIPTAVIIDQENRLITRHVGFRDREFWFNEVESLIGAQSVPEIPALSLVRGEDPGTLVLRWPEGLVRWQLQEAESPDGAWSEVNETAPATDGLHHLTLDSLTFSSRYFRLQQTPIP